MGTGNSIMNPRPINEGIYHPVHVLVIYWYIGEILIQKGTEQDTHPGLWDVS